jgi:oligosaccharide repeat unit polymerase
MDSTLKIALAVALLALALGCARFLRDASHPAAVLPGLWGGIGLAYMVLPHGLIPVSLDTWLLVAASSLCFVLGCLAGTGGRAPMPGGPVETTIWRSVIFWLSLLGLPLFAYRAVQIADSVALTDSMLVNLRIALTGEEGELQTYGVLSYLVPMAFLSTLVELATSPRRGFAARGWIALAMSLAYSILATGRTYLFVLFIAVAFVALVQRRIRPRTLLWAGAAALALAFFGLGWLLNKIGDDSSNINALGAFDALSLYLLGSLAGFDVWAASPGRLEWGLNVFRSLLAVGAALGLPTQVVPLLKEYVYVPEPTNVYTVFLPYVSDFGRLSALGFLAFFGWLHARLYRAAQSQDPRWVILYALAMYPLLMQFFQDQYFSLLTTWVQFSLMVWLCFRRRPRLTAREST